MWIVLVCVWLGVCNDGVVCVIVIWCVGLLVSGVFCGGLVSGGWVVIVVLLVE